MENNEVTNPYGANVGVYGSLAELGQAAHEGEIEAPSVVKPATGPEISEYGTVLEVDEVPPPGFSTKIKHISSLTHVLVEDFKQKFSKCVYSSNELPEGEPIPFIQPKGKVGPTKFPLSLDYSSIEFYYEGEELDLNTPPAEQIEYSALNNLLADLRANKKRIQVLSGFSYARINEPLPELPPEEVTPTPEVTQAKPVEAKPQQPQPQPQPKKKAKATGGIVVDLSTATDEVTIRVARGVVVKIDYV